jgi:hypothetical protein
VKGVREVNEYEMLSTSEIKESIIEAIAAIKSNGFFTTSEYEEAVRQDVLVDKRRWGDDLTFQRHYPDHPMNSENTGKRMYFADRIRDLTKILKEPLNDEIIGKIHSVMFDCCAAVRLSIAEALIHCAHPASIPYIESLLATVQDSELIKRAAKAALITCRSVLINQIGDEEKLIMLVSPNPELIEYMDKIANDTGGRLVINRWDYSRLIAWRSHVQVIDRDYMGKEEWEMYVDFLRDVNQIEEYPIKADDGEILFEEPYYEHSPIVITDISILRSEKEFSVPLKPREVQFFVEGGYPLLVGEIVRRAITGESLSPAEINQSFHLLQEP